MNLNRVETSNQPPTVFAMKVLIADDSLVMREMLRSYVSEWNYEFEIANDGEQAWAAFQSGDFPLVLTDWMMPGIDGVELTRRIRAADSSHYVYVVLLTAKSEKGELVEAMESGADDFLVKPCDKEELRVRLRAGERIVRLEETLAEQNRVLRETQAALVESEKLASLGQLAAGMAHEINNPISYVKNNLVVLKRDFQSLVELAQKALTAVPKIESSDEQLAAEISNCENECDLDWIAENAPESFEASIEGVDRVRKIVLNLRDFARLDEASLDKVDLQSSLESTLELLRHEMLARSIIVERNFQSVPSFLCRPDKINQLFYSVLMNAIQASDEGGSIVVSLTQHGDQIEVTIQDHGCGISDEDLSHVLEPFFTTRAVGQGAGLGLAVGYGIVRDHDGTIDVQSELGSGTSVRIRLPLEEKNGAT